MDTASADKNDLKDFWCFIGLRALDWREARLEDVGEFIAWLQLPPAGRSGVVAVLPSAAAQVTVATVNRKLAAVSAFYAHQARHGAEVGDLMAAWKAGGRGGWKPFLHHVSKGRPHRGRAIALKVPQKLPRILAVAESRRSWTPAAGCGTGSSSRCCTRAASSPEDKSDMPGCVEVLAGGRLG